MQNMQINMQKNMHNMQAICRFPCLCSKLHAICKICKIICTICKICKRYFQYAEYALPTLLMRHGRVPVFKFWVRVSVVHSLASWKGHGLLFYPRGSPGARPGQARARVRPGLGPGITSISSCLHDPTPKTIWNPVHLVQAWGSTRWYVLVRASTY